MFNFNSKRIKRNFNFNEVFDKSDLPGYIKHYILNDEKILVSYKTIRDHGIFTDTKIVLFDNYSKFGTHKQIYTIPYKSVITITVTFEDELAELEFLLQNGVPVYLKFLNVQPEDKIRLRLLYTCISRIINNQVPKKEDIKRLVNNDIKFENK